MSTGELKANAREQLRGYWAVAVGTVLVATILIDSGALYKVSEYFDMAEIGISCNLIALFLGGVISTGLCKFLLDIVTKGQEPKFKTLFSQFNIYLKTLGLNIIIYLCIAIGYILFIIPGIIISLMFSQAYYILADDNSKSINQCLSESVEMMKGYKWDLFCLELSFIGWWIIVALTFGIASLWVSPYVKVTETNFYLNIKNK